MYRDVPTARTFWSANYYSHWGRVTHICVGDLTIIGSDNGLSPGRRHAIIWINAGILLGTNFSEILIGIVTFSFKKMCLKVSSAKLRPFCPGLNVLMMPGDVMSLNILYWSSVPTASDSWWVNDYHIGLTMRSYGWNLLILLWIIRIHVHIYIVWIFMIQAWISDYICMKQWVAITHTRPNSNGIELNQIRNCTRNKWLYSISAIWLHYLAQGRFLKHDCNCI